MSKANGGARTPRDFFEPLFEVVLEEMDRNPEFAARVAERIGGAVTLKLEGVRRKPAAVPSALAELDLQAEMAEHGQIRLREKLGRFKNAELGALVRARKWSDAPVSKMNKGQLLNAIVRAVK
ncbi:MAG: hypothetical protein MRY74_05290 [Neomegalonema sp.]|nr:hypothetical protein [Neomegalonema sp.]